MPRKKAARPRSMPPRPRAPKPVKFVGRDASPVLDKYPPKDPALSVKGPPPRVTTTPSPAASPPPTAGAASPAAPIPLISLERPFDVDEFSALLGETSVRVTVPRESLAEVLRRVSEFMGFGIYVYSVSIRPTPGDLLKSFVVELQRVDYDPEKHAWTPFVEKGTSDSPFGPSGTRT
ncbi:MAG TPA: hypothetical protein VMF04_02220 [Thermoplasmata archaeon]|nr:hypothetical protein [Thermoplasmata archaeon]